MMYNIINLTIFNRLKMKEEMKSKKETQLSMSPNMMRMKKTNIVRKVNTPILKLKEEMTSLVKKDSRGMS